MSTDRRLSLLAAAAVLLAPALARAHVVLSPDRAAAGGYYVGALRVSHGCEGSPTVTLRVELPAGVVSAKPQPKPGWTLVVEHALLARPVAGEGGRLVRERVTAITWRGRLADEDFDTFGLMFKAPAGAGPLYLPVVQTCERGETRWTDIPAPGQAWHDVPHPAPVLTLGAAAGPSMEMSH